MIAAETSPSSNLSMSPFVPSVRCTALAPAVLNAVSRAACETNVSPAITTALSLRSESVVTLGCARMIRKAGAIGDAAEAWVTLAAGWWDPAASSEPSQRLRTAPLDCGRRQLPEGGAVGLPKLSLVMTELSL